MSSSKPVLAVTMGDPAGTGPEMIVKAFASPEIRQAARLVVVGDERVLREAAAITGLKVRISPVESPLDASDDPSRIDVIDLHNVPAYELRRGTVSPLSG